MSYSLIKYLYENGTLNLKDVAKEVDSGNITIEQFHSITTYNYETVKKGESL